MALSSRRGIAGKRGVFFTFTAVLLIMVILAAFTIGQRQIPLTSRIPVIKTRATQANTYLRSLEASLLPRIVADSGHRALLAMVNYSAYTGNPLPDGPNATFTELLMGGTLPDGGAPYMAGATFPDRFAVIAGLAQDAYGINTTYVLNPNSAGNNFSLVQDNETGPWHVRAEFNITILMNATLMSWNSTRYLTVLLPIEGLKDPYYAMNPSMNPGGYQPVIRRAAVPENNWTLTNFKAHVANVTYDHDIQAPDFLTRLANSSLPASSCCGIESVINPAFGYMNLPGPLWGYNWSYVDHCFFGKQCDGSREGDKRLWSVEGYTTTASPGEEGYSFLLTMHYIARYNLTEKELIVDE